jgi:hypothetical protein
MDKRIQKVLGLVESIDDRTPKKTDGIQRSYHKLMHMINKDVEGTFGDYVGESVKVVEDETAVEESIVARVQGGRKMVSAEAALRHARELANKRAPGSKPTMSDIAAAHRRLTSGVKHESEEIDELSNDLLSRYKKAASADSIAADKAGDTKKADKRFSGVMRATKKQFANDAKTVSESFAVKDASGKTVTVKYSENDAKKVAEELTKKTGQKHSVKYERTATVKEDTDGKDTVVLEIPALIRALEWAREDAEDDVEIHKFVEKLINHEGTVDMEFFSEEIIPSADRKVDKNGRPYPAHRVQVGTNESETLKVGDTVWAKDQKLSYKTHSGKILSISKETVTIKLKSGATQTFPKKAVSSDFETLNPYKRTDESIEESKVSSTYEISYDYGPHMSKTVSISANSEKEAEKEVIRTAAKEGHRNIMINWIRKDAQQSIQRGTNESAPNRSINDDDWYIYDPNSGKQIKQFSPAPAKMRFAGDRDSHVPNHIKPELEKARKEHGSQLRADKGMTAKYSIKESTGNFHKRLPTRSCW